ncbi:hypothetical protein BD410DRAFT_845570 [Rickenella mellea]|uniref:Uncharacterized protein n=1 Tax=Rickenella mellea TaxID=50990 RepID=A0A4Y7PKC5_9AGAM|nr:hypothetical protein BD410DRAFT_845570 [Rickenella mellea]
MTANSSSPKKQVTTSADKAKPQLRTPNSQYWALTRQLQLRLQYARLKVEHGWQKQNLNEVENLYFRQHQIRKPPASATVPVPEVYDLNSPAKGQAQSSRHLGVEASEPLRNISPNQEAHFDPDVQPKPSDTAQPQPARSTPVDPPASDSTMQEPSETQAAQDQRESMFPTDPSKPQEMSYYRPHVTRRSPEKPKLEQGQSPIRPHSRPHTPSPSVPTTSSGHVVQPKPQSGAKLKDIPPRKLAPPIFGPRNPEDGSSSGQNTGYSRGAPMTYDSFWSSHSQS